MFTLHALHVLHGKKDFCCCFNPFTPFVFFVVETAFVVAFPFSYALDVFYPLPFKVRSMIRHKRLPEDIMNRIQEAANYLERRADVVFAHLFGGLAKRPPKPLSDVDIAVYLSENMDFAHEKIDLLEDLIDLLHTDEIDLVVLNQSSLLLSMNVIKHSRVLVDKKPFVRHAFQSLVMRKYFDYQQVESAILRRRFYHG